DAARQLDVHHHETDRHRRRPLGPALAPGGLARGRGDGARARRRPGRRRPARGSAGGAARDPCPAGRSETRRRPGSGRGPVLRRGRPGSGRAGRDPDKPTGARAPGADPDPVRPRSDGMTYDDDILMRRIDGELPPEEGERIDAAAQADPALAARLEAMRRLRGAAREAFPVQVDPRDLALARLIGAAEAARPSALDGVRGALADAFAPRRAALWGGLATAAFVGGLLLGPLLGGAGEGLNIQSGGVLADAGLVRAL